MRLSEPRVKPLSDGDLSDDQRAQIAPMRPTSRGDGRSAPDVAPDPPTGPVLNIFRTLVHHPQLLKRWTVFANHVLFKSSLPARDREIVILRIGWLCRSEYEWGQHCAIGRTAGLSDDEIRGVADGKLADPIEQALLDATDELHADAFVSDATWKKLLERYSTEQMMDIVFAVGQYNLVSMALNSFGVQLDDGVKTFMQTAGREPS